jgi:hypothetical protein
MARQAASALKDKAVSREEGQGWGMKPETVAGEIFFRKGPGVISVPDYGFFITWARPLLARLPLISELYTPKRERERERERETGELRIW